MTAAFAEDAVPGALKADEVGEGVVGCPVPYPVQDDDLDVLGLCYHNTS